MNELHLGTELGLGLGIGDWTWNWIGDWVGNWGLGVGELENWRIGNGCLNCFKPLLFMCIR